MASEQHLQTNWRPWLVVGFSFLALALAYSTRAAFGLVMPLLEQDLGWSRSFTSGIAATALMMTAVLAPLGGRLVDKQGARAVVLLGMGLLGTGCILVAITSHPLAFLFAFGGVAATGFGLVAIHVVSGGGRTGVRDQSGGSQPALRRQVRPPASS